MRTNPLTTSGVARRITNIVLLAAIGVLLGAALPTAVGAQASQEKRPGGIGLRLVDAPIAAKDDRRARIYIVDHLAPGAVIQRRVEVSNTTTDAEDVVLYAAAASIHDGTFVGAAGRAPNDLASWTSLSPASTRVTAGGTQTAVVTITVPADAAPGEQYGVVWAEARSTPDADRGVTQVSRVGIRLYVSVGPGAAPAADFSIDALTAERSAEGEPVVSATVRNTGGRALDMKGSLVLTNGPGGLTAGPFPAELGSTLAIGDTQAVRIALDERLPDGPWDAVVTLESGLTQRSANASITFPASGSAASVLIEPSPGPPWPLVLIGTGIAVLLAVAGWVLRRGRRPRSWVPTHGVTEPAVQVGRTAESARDRSMLIPEQQRQ